MGIFSHYVHMLPAPLVPAGIFPGFCLAPPPNTSKNQTHSKASLRRRGPRVQPSTLICAGGLQGSSPGRGGREESLPSAFSTDLSPLYETQHPKKSQGAGLSAPQGKFNSSFLYDVGFKITNHQGKRAFQEKKVPDELGIDPILLDSCLRK